jgi:tetratricopeptide (TPR) repeat protein
MAGGVLGSADFPRELREALTAKAEGVPLYVEEVAKTLLDVGVLRRENGGYRLVRRPEEAGVPDTIQGIIMARLDRLGEDGKRTVQLASVIGRQFLKRLLGRIAGLTHELDGLLRELKTLEIIYELGLLPEPSYIFKHAVIQDVAYQSLLVQRRRDLHRAVGHAIEELYADRLADHYEELAHHFAQGEAWAKAFEYLVRSGDKARDTSGAGGFSEISALLDIGYGLTQGGETGPALSLLEETIGRVEKGLGNHRWRWDIRVSVGIAEALVALGRGDEAPEWIDRAVATARSTRSAKYLGKCHALLGEIALLGRRWDVAVTELGHDLALARRIENPTLTWQVAHLLARAQAASGRLDEAAAIARLALVTIELVSARAPEPSLRPAFVEWPRVQAAREDLDRILR